MKKIFKLVTISLFLLTIGCGDNTITSDNPLISETVIELLKSHLKDQLVSTFILQEFGAHPSVWGNPSYETLKKGDVENKNAQRVVTLVDEAIDPAILTLHSIRTIEDNKELNKISCSAVVRAKAGPMVSNGEEFDLYDITYTAQLTDDNNDIYVEIIDLTEK